MPIHLVSAELVIPSLLFVLLRNFKSDVVGKLSIMLFVVAVLGIYFIFFLGKGASINALSVDALKRKEIDLDDRYYRRIHKSCRAFHPKVGIFYTLNKRTLTNVLDKCIVYTVNLMMLH